MIHEILIVGRLGCNCSIVADESSREALVIDPGDDVQRISALLQHRLLSLKQIIITHAHIDHIAGARSLQRLTGAPILYNQRDLALVAMMDVQAGWLGLPVPEVLPPDASLEHGSIVGVANLQATVLHTPGHTQGSICLYLPEQRLLFAGDTLFAGSIGRTDLPGGDGPTLLRSIHDHLLPLPDETTVVPGHGPQTTIGSERQHNAYLRHL